jgi:acetyltransferase-like isoleucine patch superfamily enzyme
MDLMNTKSAAIVIEDDVFIGTNAIILKGVMLGQEVLLVLVA